MGLAPLTDRPPRKASSYVVRNPKGTVVSFRIEDRLLGKVDEIARRRGVSRSKALRAIIESSDADASTLNDVAREFAELNGRIGAMLGELGKQGSNVNQIARKLNQGCAFSESDAKGLAEALGCIRDVRRELALIGEGAASEVEGLV